MTPRQHFAAYLHDQLALIYLRLRHSRKLVERFRDRHAGETIFCVNSGPSLNEEHLQHLHGQIVVFVKSAYQALQRCQLGASYRMVQDHQGLYRFQHVDRTVFAASFRSCHNLGYSLRPPPFAPRDIILLPRISRSRWGSGPGSRRQVRTSPAISPIPFR